MREPNFRSRRVIDGATIALAMVSTKLFIINHLQLFYDVQATTRK